MEIYRRLDPTHPPLGVYVLNGRPLRRESVLGNSDLLYLETNHSGSRGFDNVMTSFIIAKTFTTQYTTSLGYGWSSLDGQASTILFFYIIVTLLHMDTGTNIYVYPSRAISLKNHIINLNFQAGCHMHFPRWTPSVGKENTYITNTFNWILTQLKPLRLSFSAKNVKIHY